MGRIAIPPGSPQFDPAPVRTPIDVQSNTVLFKGNTPWEKCWTTLYGAVLYLLSHPAFLSGLDASKPDATLYPENSRYYSTNTGRDWVNLYGIPDDPTTASWTLIP